MIDQNFWAGKKVLVTGHTGFKGSWLSIWLNSMSARVYGISLPPQNLNSLFCLSQLEKNLFSNEFIDICKFEDLRNSIQKINPDVVFHMAAQPLVIESYSDPLKTWLTNVQGSINLLEALKSNNKICSVVMITTDKVYENKNWDFSYRENDRLGGHDPYSASKAAAEIAIASWRSSFCGDLNHQTKFVDVATARSGNVIGGGDWAKDRIIPDIVRSLSKGKEIEIRSPYSRRPWQHVIEPLAGYLLLAENLYNYSIKNKSNNSYKINNYATSFNFGPYLESNKTVLELVNEIFKTWPGDFEIINQKSDLYESKKLNLQIEKARLNLNWSPKWSFETAIKKTINWYKKVLKNPSLAIDLCIEDINDYQN